jgi:hypothetical protein
MIEKGATNRTRPLGPKGMPFPFRRNVVYFKIRRRIQEFSGRNTEKFKYPVSQALGNIIFLDYCIKELLDIINSILKS